MRPPDLEEPQEWERNWMDSVIQDGLATYDETFELIHHLRRLRALRVKGRAPHSFAKIMGEGIRAPMSWAHVQTIVGMIAKNRPKFSRVPRSPREKEAAQRLANTASPTLDTLERLAHKPLYYLFADQLAGDGRGVMKYRLTPWEGYPIQLDSEEDSAYNDRVEEWLKASTTQPFRLSLVDPLNFMPSRDEWDTTYVIERGKRPTRPTLDKLGLTFHTGSGSKLRQIGAYPTSSAYATLELPRGVGPTIDVEEIWTDEHVYIRIGNETYFKAENDLGFIPYVWRLGEQTSIPDPALEGVSSIFPFVGVEPWLNSMLSVIAAWAMLGSTPIMWTSRDVSAASGMQGRTPVSDIPLGKRIDLGPGGKAGFLEPPTVGREVIEFTQLLLSVYEKAGMTPMARGLIGTRTPGLTLSAALEAASDRLKPVIFSLEDAFSELMSKIWRSVENNIKQPVSVYGDGFEKGRFGVGRKKIKNRFVIDPKDINGYYDCDVEIKISNLQDLTNQGMHAAFMNAHRLWSKERAMRFSGVDDPFDEYLQLTREAFRDDPRVMEMLFRQAMQEDPELGAELEALLAEGEAGLEQAAMGGMPLPGAAPGGEPEGGGEEGVFGGAPQPRGGPSPMAGGSPAGMPRRPTGPRPVTQGQRFGGPGGNPR